MTDLTREQIEALLDVTTPGNWLASPDGNGEWGVDTDDGWGIATVAASAGLKGDNGFTEGNARLIAAAPDLARQLLATMTALVEAQAAQAVVVEMCAEVPRKHAKHLQKNGLTAMSSDFDHIETDIRSLADQTGVKLLAELRQREANLALHAANLADQLAEAQKREAGLREALNLADAALTEAEAILGGEYGDHYGPLCETMLDLRDRIAALPSATQAGGWMPPEVPLAVKEAFANSVWDALKADANDLRKQWRIVRAFDAAFAPLPPAPEASAQREEARKG